MEEYILKQNPDGSKVTVKDVQDVLLTMLKDIDKICTTYDIPYFLIGGSALGALRHKGFIPWDDDADIAMMKDDYDRFLDVLQKHCPEHFVFQCFEVDHRYNVLIPGMKIRLKGTYLKEVNTLLENKCVGYDGCDGIFIDVFVYDYATKNKFYDVPLRLLQYPLMAIEIVCDNYLHFNPVLTKKAIVKIARNYGKHNKKKNSPYIGLDLTWVWKNPFKPYIYRKDDIYPVKYVDFEDTKLPVPKNTEVFLTTEIGPDYMTPPSGKQKAPKHIVEIDLGREECDVISGKPCK